MKKKTSKGQVASFKRRLQELAAMIKLSEKRVTDFEKFLAMSPD